MITELNGGKAVIYQGDCRDVLTTLPDGSVQTVVTSPPYYGLRDYQVDGQMGLEQTPDEYVTSMVEVFREVRRVLREDGTMWLNMGDSYGANWSSRRPEGGGGLKVDKGRERIKKPPPGLKPKDLIGIPWRLALALQADGWWLRQDIIWHKPNPMPESVTDRCTKAHEYIFLMTKAARYYYDAEAIMEPAKWERWGNQTEKKDHTGTAGHLGGKTLDQLPIKDKKNKRSVWSVNTTGFPGAHFAVFPSKLIEPCIKAGCKEGDTVLDPFMGSGTTGEVAINHSCKFIGIELNEEYIKLAVNRLKQSTLF